MSSNKISLKLTEKEYWFLMKMIREHPYNGCYLYRQKKNFILKLQRAFKRDLLNEI